MPGQRVDSTHVRAAHQAVCWCPATTTDPSHRVPGPLPLCRVPLRRGFERRTPGPCGYRSHRHRTRRQRRLTRGGRFADNPLGSPDLGGLASALGSPVLGRWAARCPLIGSRLTVARSPNVAPVRRVPAQRPVWGRERPGSGIGGSRCRRRGDARSSFEQRAAPPPSTRSSRWRRCGQPSLEAEASGSPGGGRGGRRRTSTTPAHYPAGVLSRYAATARRLGQGTLPTPKA